MKRNMKHWINCYEISNGFVSLTCPHCRGKILARTNDIFNYSYCPLCGKYVGFGSAINDEETKTEAEGEE